MKRVIFTALFCLGLIAGVISGAAHAMATVPATYMPLVTGPTGPITVLRPPVDFLLDSPVLATDGGGNLWLVVQAVVNKDNDKAAVVYRVLPDGSLVEMERDADIYAKPRFAELPEGEVVYGSDEHGNVHIELVEGFTP